MSFSQEGDTGFIDLSEDDPEAWEALLKIVYSEYHSPKDGTCHDQAENVAQASIRHAQQDAKSTR